MKKRICIVIIIIEKRKRKKLRKLIKFEGENKKTWVGTGISFIWEGIRKI
jgi:hypothetical protein